MEHIETQAAATVNNLVNRRLLDERRIFLWEAVTDGSSRTIVEQLAYLDAVQPGTPIHLYINSPGGVVSAGFAIYDMMLTVSSPVYTYCIGMAASMGSILLSGGKKGNRYIYPRAEVMIHQPSISGFQASSADIEINARQIMKTKERTAALLAANCGQSIERILQDFDRDYWMNAEEAVGYGIVDKILPA